MQSFGSERVAVVVRHARTTAFTNSDLLDSFGEGRLRTVDLSFARKCASDAFGSAA
jgi:hypothetical protein